jgi:hypothetical protein
MRPRKIVSTPDVQLKQDSGLLKGGFHSPIFPVEEAIAVSGLPVEYVHRMLQREHYLWQAGMISNRTEN